MEGGKAYEQKRNKTSLKRCRTSLDQDVLVLHRYGDTSHFLAIESRVFRHIACDPIFPILRAIQGKIGPMRALRQLKEMLTNLLSKNRSKYIVYGFAPESLYFVPLLLLWWKPGRRILFTSFSDQLCNLGFAKRKIVEINLHFAGKYFQSCAAVSTTTKKILSPYLQTQLVEHAVNQEKYRVQKTTMGLIHLGRIVEYKNVDRIIEAAIKLEMRLDLVGPAAKKIHYLNNLPETIKLKGPRSKSWIEDNIGRYEALVLASSPREPFGIVLLEAMSAGVPVICSRTNGTDTIFRYWPDYPFLYNSNDEGGLEKCISSFKNTGSEELKEIKHQLVEVSKQYSVAAKKKIWDEILK